MKYRWHVCIADTTPEPYTGDNPRCRAVHTPRPDNYLGWHEWAAQMSKTQKQERCPHCGLWSVWVKKPPRMTAKDRRALQRAVDGV